MLIGKCVDIAGFSFLAVVVVRYWMDLARLLMFFLTASPLVVVGDGNDGYTAGVNRTIVDNKDTGLKEIFVGRQWDWKLPVQSTTGQKRFSESTCRE